MTFLCEQPSFDGSNIIYTLRKTITEATNSDDFGTHDRLSIEVRKCYPTDKDEKDLWMEVENKGEAEEIAIKSMLAECETVGPNWIAAGSRVAMNTRRGAGNVILIGKGARNNYNIGTQVKAIYIRYDIPDGVGISLYKGPSEIDSSFYYSMSSEGKFLFRVPTWRDYATLFDATLIDNWNQS